MSDRSARLVVRRLDPKSSRHRRLAAQQEAALLREARRFVRATAWQLGALIEKSRTLREGLAQTEAYRRVDGTDDAGDEPVWDLAATLEVLLERDLDDVSPPCGGPSAGPENHYRRLRGRLAASSHRPPRIE
jgi:hypothetical protein